MIRRKGLRHGPFDSRKSPQKKWKNWSQKCNSILYIYIKIWRTDRTKKQRDDDHKEKEEKTEGFTPGHLP